MVSVVVVNWNTRDLLLACLQSLRAFPPTRDYEVIVVDNASRDGSAEAVRERFPEVRLLAETANHGYARGNNLGIAAAKGDLILTLNPDTEFVDDSLDRAASALEADPRLGCVAVRLVGTDGRTQRSVRGFPSILGILGDVTPLGKWLPNSRFGSYRLPAFDYERDQDAPQPMGTFLLFRRDALAAVGDPTAPFDEGFPIFFNEVDLLARLAKAGWRCRYLSGPRILHHGGESTRQVRKAMIWESHRSLVRYLRKHSGATSAFLAAPFIYLGALIRARGYGAGFRS